MDLKKLSRIFVVVSYYIGAVVLPNYFIFQYLLWLATIDRTIFILTSIPSGILLGFWCVLAIGVFGYSIED